MDITSISKQAISGFTIALLMIPEAIAFSFLIGMHPSAGLKGSTITTFITSILGGQPGLISGTAASTVSTIKGVREKFGNDYVFLTVVIAGILQILVSFSSLYTYFDYIPAPVLSGFLIGLAYLIIKGQSLHLQETKVESFKEEEKPTWLPHNMLTTTIFFSLLELILMLFLESSNIPFMSTLAPLITIALMSSIVHFIPSINVQTIGQRASLQGAVPKLHIPKVEWSFKSIGKLIKYSASMMFAGLVESIIMLKQVNKIVSQKGSVFKETFAQGVANGVSGMTGGLGGCVLAGQTILNIQNKTLTRFSSLCTSLTLFLIGLSFTGLLNYIPMPSIIAIMLYIGWKTALAGDIKQLYRKIDISWVITMFTLLLTLFTENLSIATILGTILYYILPK